MTDYSYGHDFGNAETDGVLFARGGQEVVRSMPTAEVVAPSEQRMRNLGVDLGNTVLFRMQGENTTFMIGDGAITQMREGSAVTHRGNIARYASDSSKRALLANAASMIPDKAFSLRVVTGVPVETYAEDDRIRQQIIDTLSGTYTFTINNDDTRTVNVVVEKVVAEGAGVVIGYGTANAVLQGVIDCGGRTLDLYVSEGQKPKLDKCRSFVVGVESAIDLLRQNFRERYGRQMSTAEARAVMFASIGRGSYPALSARGRDILAVDQRALALEVTEVVGKQIASCVASTWNEGESSDQVASSLKQVFFAGRGALYFYPYIQQIIAPDQLKRIDHPGGANAYGYASLARRVQVRALNSVAS